MGFAKSQNIANIGRNMKAGPCTSSFKKHRSSILLVFVSALLSACNSSRVPPKPNVQITLVPAANPGGPVQLEFIEGRASGVEPGQRIVLYARSDIWWIQPFANQPFTEIQPDSTWRNSTHLGTDYAALLVEPGFHPATKLPTLPAEGNGVIAIATSKGKFVAPIVPKVIHFSGYDWRVRNAASDRGGEPNSYDPSNVWIDKNGYLHLRMEEHDGVWTCAEVSLTRSLGYGSYIFVVQDIGHLGPSAALGLYTNDDFRTDDIRSELDIELSRWGIADNKNAQYVVQPFYIPENVSRFMAPAGVLTHMLRWESERASFKTVRGSMVGPGSTISEHIFTSGIPIPAKETAHMGLYSYRHSKSSSQQPVEVVIEKFEFLP
ncbi:glycoside hydrolase family 16 protein [Tunturibacter psychrotolerans]|uniref:Glycoside hydrolase family 16 protein n=1 Tax=Tunturiibacter psychrotolerans TaxID=3069686 RepID=A0AAU7ZN94_9BACT